MLATPSSDGPGGSPPESLRKKWCALGTSLAIAVDASILENPPRCLKDNSTSQDVPTNKNASSTAAVIQLLKAIIQRSTWQKIFAGSKFAHKRRPTEQWAWLYLEECLSAQRMAVDQPAAYLVKLSANLSKIRGAVAVLLEKKLCPLAPNWRERAQNRSLIAVWLSDVIHPEAHWWTQNKNQSPLIHPPCASALLWWNRPWRSCPNIAYFD